MIYKDSLGDIIFSIDNLAYWVTSFEFYTDDHPYVRNGGSIDTILIAKRQL